MATYRDRWISCADDGIRVRGYYFPWGTKRVRYADIRSVRRVGLAACVDGAGSGAPRTRDTGRAWTRGGRVSSPR